MTTAKATSLLCEDEVELTAIRAQGAGGQNVNKVSNAVHLRFDIRASSLPEELKTRLLQFKDQRISAEERGRPADEPREKDEVRNPRACMRTSR